MRKPVFVVAVAALTVGLSVQAQNAPTTGGFRYKWRDAQGLPHYSDSLTADAMKYGYDLVNDQGLAVQHVDRQLNPEERAAARKQAEQQALLQRQAEEQARNDAQMLSAYPDEASLQSSQQQALATIDQQMSTTRINLHSQEKALTELLDRAADAERAKQPVPKDLNDRIAKQRDVVSGQRAVLEREQAARDATQQQDAKQLQHYRDLKAAQAAQDH